MIYINLYVLSVKKLKMDKVYIENIIQKIINKEFIDDSRRKIVVYNDRLNFCAPCCGDSHKNKHAKRGNLYFNRLIYICFNCDKRTTFDRLCKDFNEQIDPEKKLEIIEHLNSNIDYSDYENDLVETSMEDLIDIKDLEEVFNVKKISPIFDFKPIQINGGVYKYLVGRGIPPEIHKDIYQAKYSKGDQGYEHVIVLLNRKKNKVLGLQVRNLKSGKRRFFVIYNWEHLWRWVNGEDCDLDMNKTILYNKLSYFFNIMNIDFEKKVTLFEGFIDSLFYPNSVGMVGANTDDNILKSNNLDIQYFYDNDETGFKKATQKIKEGKSVFLWKKFFNKIVEGRKNIDPYKVLWRISKVKDLNKLAEISPNPYMKFKLNELFSEDVMDMRWIPKRNKVKIVDEKDYDKEFKHKDW
jgi:hypothetical protein